MMLSTLLSLQQRRMLIAHHWLWIALLALHHLIVADGGPVVRDAYWTSDTVETPQNSNISLTCNIVGGVQDYDVIRVVHSHGAKTLLVSDNDWLSPTFSDLQRFSIGYSRQDNTGLVTINVTGVRAEDSGTMACQKMGNDEFIAYVDVIVYAPVGQLYLSTISPADSDERQLDSDSDIFLQETDSFTAVCTVKLNGSEALPRITVTIGNDDVTNRFNETSSSVAMTMSSGLTRYEIEMRLVGTIGPVDHAFNGKTLKCIAMQRGFDDVMATANLVVQYEPIMTCPESSISVAPGNNLTLICTIKANPGGRVTWSTLSDDVIDNYDIHSDNKVQFFYRAVRDDVTEVSLHIKNVGRRHSRSYSLRTDNVMGTSWAMMAVVVLPGEDVPDQVAAETENNSNKGGSDIVVESRPTENESEENGDISEEDFEALTVAPRSVTASEVQSQQGDDRPLTQPSVDLSTRSDRPLLRPVEGKSDQVSSNPSDGLSDEEDYYQPDEFNPAVSTASEGLLEQGRDDETQWNPDADELQGDEGIIAIGVASNTVTSAPPTAAPMRPTSFSAVQPMPTETRQQSRQQSPAVDPVRTVHSTAGQQRSTLNIYSLLTAFSAICVVLRNVNFHFPSI